MITHLYVKIHKVTKLKYFGKTTKSNVEKYSGSGKYWTNHYRKHGKEHIITLKIWSFTNIEECKQFAIKFSNDNNIINSKAWANLVNENGIDGGTGNANPMFGKTHSQSAKLVMSKITSERLTGTKWYNNGIDSKMFKKPPNSSWIIGRLTKGSKNPFLDHTHSQESKNKISKTKLGIPSPKMKKDGYEKYVYSIFWKDGKIDITPNLSSYCQENNIKLNLYRFLRPNPPNSKTLLKIERNLKL